MPTRASVRHSGSVLPTPSAMLSPISRQGIKPNLLIQQRIDSAAVSIRLSGYHVAMNKRLMRGFGVTYRSAQGVVGTIEAERPCELVPTVGRLLHDGTSGDRCIHPRGQ